MSKSKQQKQVKNVFEKLAEKWAKKAKSSKINSINVIKQRNDFVIKPAAKFLKKNDKVLDVGCGTGDLVIDLHKLKFDAYGIDFSKSMIKKAVSRATKQGIDRKKFRTVSFFDYEPDSKFRLIAANGFIEYISEEEFVKFIKKSYSMLDKKGFLVFSSRNRLFNLFSHNNYTRSEIRTSSSNELLRECILFNKIKNFQEALKQNFKSGLKTNLKYHEREGSDILVDTRFQYTPFQIINLLKKYKFKPVELLPIHIHVFPINTRNNPPRLHDYVSNYIQNQKHIPIQFILQSSSFMILARKNE